jgi:hypothetical protein
MGDTAKHLSPCLERESEDSAASSSAMRLVAISLKSPSSSSADVNTSQLLRTLERKEDALLKLSMAGRHANAPWKIA